MFSDLPELARELSHDLVLKLVLRRANKVCDILLAIRMTDNPAINLSYAQANSFLILFFCFYSCFRCLYLFVLNEISRL